MKEKKVGDMTVNDGKGLFDSEGLCDSLLLDLNSLPKLLMSGQYIQFCAAVTGMGQKLMSLKTGIKNDMDSMSAKVEELKRANDSLIEKGGGENGIG